MPEPQTKNRAPVVNPVSSFWNAHPHELDDHRTTVDLPSRSDIVIIGSGFAGAATAYHILEDNPSPPSIIVLEARKIASGATGRNGGHVKPDPYYNVSKYTHMYGAEAASEVAAFEASNVYAIKRLVEKEGLDCDFHLTRGLDVYLDYEHAKASEEAYGRLVQDGVVNLHDVAYTPKKDAERVSGVKGAQCCFSFTAAHLYPLKMVRQLLQRLLPKGLNLQANTPVRSVSQFKNTDGLWTVQTDRGTILARKVVYATNGYTAQVLPDYAGRIVPVRGICSQLVSPLGPDSPHLVNTYGIRFNAQNFDYLIPRTDGSIVVGGARQRFWHVKDAWFDNVRDDELVENVASYFDGYMQRHFRGWEASGTQTKHVWTGIMGYSSDFMPHLGEIPDKPDQYIIAGFSGHGMPDILLSSQGVARMVRDGIPYEQSGLPRLFKTTKARVTSHQNPLEDSLKPMWEKTCKAQL